MAKFREIEKQFCIDNLGCGFSLTDTTWNEVLSNLDHVHGQGVFGGAAYGGRNNGLVIPILGSFGIRNDLVDDVAVSEHYIPIKFHHGYNRFVIVAAARTRSFIHGGGPNQVLRTQILRMELWKNGGVQRSGVISLGPGTISTVKKVDGLLNSRMQAGFKQIEYGYIKLINEITNPVSIVNSPSFPSSFWDGFSDVYVKFYKDC